MLRINIFGRLHYIRQLGTTKLALSSYCEKNANQRIKNIDGMGFQEVLDLAQQRPDDRHISPNRESFCTFYIP